MANETEVGISGATATQKPQDGDRTVYVTVVNDAEQWSVWPAARPLPVGWKASGRSGSKQECLEYVQEVWVDMRPLSVRKNTESSQA
jgi:MbtH protein